MGGRWRGGGRGRLAPTSRTSSADALNSDLAPGRPSPAAFPPTAAPRTPRASAKRARVHRHTAYGAHLEYFLGPAALRAEYAGQTTEEYTSNAAYAEASWRLAKHWLVAARYDWAKTKLDEDAGVDEDLLEHQDVGLAVNYFFSPNFVLKLAVHQVTGNRFTSVDDEDAEQDEKTTLVTFGTSFSF